MHYLPIATGLLCKLCYITKFPNFTFFYINVIVESSGWFAAGGLEKGKEYEFRVKAKNRAGLGEPSQPSETVTPKAKASTYIRTFCFVFMMFSNFFMARPHWRRSRSRQNVVFGKISPSTF